MRSPQYIQQHQHQHIPPSPPTSTRPPLLKLKVSPPPRSIDYRSRPKPKRIYRRKKMEPEGEAARIQDDLHLWIHGHDTTPCVTFFTRSPPFSLKDLHIALQRAVKEISLKLDPTLECTFDTARNEEHCIVLEESQFVEERILDVDELMDMGERIESLNRERVVQLLNMCRDEIQWEKNEIHRLDVHCEVARAQKQMGYRESFQYRPLPRKSRQVIPGVGVYHNEKRRDSGRHQNVIRNMEEGEDDDVDVDMLDGDEEDGKDVKVEERDEKAVKVEEQDEEDMKYID